MEKYSKSPADLIAPSEAFLYLKLFYYRLYNYQAKKELTHLGQPP